MRPSKLLHSGIAALVVAGGLVGCGAASRVGAQNATLVACEYPMPTDSTTVNVLAYNSSAIDPFTNTMVKSCTQGKVTLKHDPIDFGGQVTKTIATLAGDRGSYDIIETYGFVIPGFGSKGDIEPLDGFFEKYAEKYQLNDLNPTMRQGLSYNGKLYGLPMQAQMFILTYRKDIFEALNLKPPTTFADMIEASKVIQAEQGMKYPIAMPWLATADVATHYEAAMNSFGKTSVDADGNAQFSSEESRKSLLAMRSLMPYMDPQVTTFDQPKVQQQMFNGTAAMSVLFSGRLNDLTESSNTRFANDFAFTAAPKVAGENQFLYSRLSIDGWSIPKNTSLDKDMLFRMMASSVGEKASKASVPAAYPARMGMVTPGSSAYAAASNVTIDGTLPPVDKAYSAAVNNAIRPTLVRVLTGQLEVEEGMREMQLAAERIIAGS